MVFYALCSIFVIDYCYLACTREMEQLNEGEYQKDEGDDYNYNIFYTFSVLYFLIVFIVVYTT